MARAASLLARVTVNRWWAHHFGAGIVATTDNLGYSGAPPTHPDLLEYLAGELVRGGWSAKAIHRLILHSATYRQSSAPTPESARQDPEARLLSRFPLRRLDAEAIRDAMLAVAGELDEARGGAYVPTRFGDDGDVVVEPDTPGALRRSVYLQQRRTQVLGMLSVFDAPSLVTNCTFRMQTTVPLQSLKLLNSEFVRERSTALAQRVLKSDAATTDERLSVAFELACSRRPTAPEFEAARTFILAQPSEYAGSDRAEELAWTDFCQALLASSAFLYVE